MIRKLLKICRWCALSGILLLLVLLACSPFYIYDRFNQEIPIARLEFARTGEHEFIARLGQGDFCAPKQYAILGDQFQLDAGFVKWKGFAILLGFEPRYRLDRLSGRYRDIEAQNNLPALSHDLAPDVLFDFFADNKDAGESGWLVDTSYGSSVYQTIDETRRYTIYSTEDGLITRSEPHQDFGREQGNLRIEITHGCGEVPGLLESLSGKVNSLVTSISR